MEDSGQRSPQGDLVPLTDSGALRGSQSSPHSAEHNIPKSPGKMAESSQSDQQTKMMQRGRKGVPEPPESVLGRHETPN